MRDYAFLLTFSEFLNNEKVLLRERKRHTARCVAIASPCYSGGGGFPSTNFFFPSLNMYQAKSGVKKFSLYWEGGGGSLDKKFFFWAKHVSSLIWCQKIFLLLKPGPPLDLDLGPPLDLGTPPGPGTPLPQTWTWDPPTWTWGPPYLDLDMGPPSPRPGPGTPPTWTWTWDPPTWTWDPPLGVD